MAFEEGGMIVFRELWEAGWQFNKPHLAFSDTTQRSVSSTQKYMKRTFQKKLPFYVQVESLFWRIRSQFAAFRKIFMAPFVLIVLTHQ